MPGPDPVPWARAGVAPAWVGPREAARRQQAAGPGAGPAPGEAAAPGPLYEVKGRELLRRLHEDLAYPRLTEVLLEIACRVDRWRPELREELCATVLDRGLFLAYRPHPSGGPGAHPAGPDEATRAANAASLYIWAVRPYAGRDWANARLAELLPGLWFGRDRASRAAVEWIVRSDPRLLDEVWLGLLGLGLAGATAAWAPYLPARLPPAPPAPPAGPPRTALLPTPPDAGARIPGARGGPPGTLMPGAGPPAPPAPGYPDRPRPPAPHEPPMPYASPSGPLEPAVGEPPEPEEETADGEAADRWRSRLPVLVLCAGVGLIVVAVVLLAQFVLG
ncbi:hypothetical protein RKE29_04020 [Streptomyces sp. B1866]|uniref:hypothetical protein n=1 Tax=Streptomyces sp. B1866 TaxID=3075431 RepID=UPI00288EA780|nr:hypothetical protein [Streptomyces sp. B1866]MDT3395817.1 hypothetical protein [Streptomyces sp. B1866]